MIGIDSPSVTSAARPASFRAPARSEPTDAPVAGAAVGAMVRGGSIAALLNLFDFGPAEDARGHEDQHDSEDREGGYVLVLDREISGPQRLDETDDEPAEHRARQRADAAEHRRRERLHAWHEAVGEAHDPIVEEVH